MSLLVASQLVDKDMDDTEEGEILEDGEIADEDESTGGDHKTTSSTVTTTTTTDIHTLQIDNKERRHDSENRRSEDRNRDKDNNNRGPEARDRARERRERHERQERERKSSSIDRDRKTSVGEDERRRKERELRNSDRKRRRSDEERDERERDRDDRQRDDRRKRLRDQNWDEFNNENNNRNTTYDGFPRRPFEDFDFRLPAEPSHGFSSSGPHERDRFEDEEMFDEQEFEDMLQMMEQRMPPRVGAMSLMEKKAMMKTMMTMMSRMDPDKSRRFARLRERRRTNDQPTGAPPGPRPPIRPLDHRPPNSFKPLCKYFLDGKCHKGADCPFSHDANPPKKKELCKFYLQGFCGKGEDCLFMHGEFPCKFFHTNVECYSGDNCRFSHAPLTEQTREILRNYLDSGTLPDDPKPDRYHRSHTNADSDNRNKSQTDSHNHNNTSDKNESNPDNCDTSAGQSSGFAPVKPVAKRHAVLGDVTTEMKKSYLTWVWQQEMKELEIAYVGNKRNLFCIEKPFVMTEKPTTPRMEDDEEEIEEQIRNYYRDTMPEMEIPEDVGDVDHRIAIDTPVAAIQVPAVNPEEQMLIEMSAHDEDLRTLMMPRPRSHTNESMPPMTGDIDERSAVMVTEAIEQPMPMPADLPQNVPTTARELYYKMQNRIANRLQTESEKSLDYQSDSDDDDRNVLAAALKNVQQSSANKSPSSSDKISQMLAAIRNNTAANQSPKQEFWQNFMSGFNMPGGSPQAGGSTPPKSEYRDPRLKRGKESMSPSIDTTPPVKICDPNVKIEYKLIAIKVPEIDYSTYVSLYRIDGRLKNDPRLNKFFSKLPTSEIDNLSRIVPPPLKTAPVTPLSVLKSKKKSEKERQKEKITPERSDKEGSPTLPPLPPLTISPSKSATTPGIFPPTPPPIMSPLELISSRPTYTVSDNKSSHIKAEPLDVFALSKNGHQRRDSTDSKPDEKTPPPPLLLSHRRRSSSSSYSPPKLSEPIKSPVKSPTDKTADPLPCYVPSSVESILKNSFSYSTDATDRKPINPFMSLTSNPSSLSSSSLTKELYESSFDKSIDSSDVKTDNDKEEQMETSSNSSEDLYENLNLFQLITAEKDVKPKPLSSPRSSIDELELIRTELKAPPMTMTSIDSSDNEMEIDLRRRTDSVSEVESADECELMIASSSEPEDNNNEPEVVNHYLKLPKNESKEVNVISSSDEPINSSSDQTTEVSNQLTEISNQLTDIPNVSTEPLTEVTDKPTDLSNDSSDQKPETSDPLVTNSVESEPQNKELDSESKVLSANEAVDETATDQPMNLIVSETPVTEAEPEAELEPQVTESCDQSLKSVFSTIDPTASPFC